MSDYDMDQQEQDIDLSFAAEAKLPEGEHEYRIVKVKQVTTKAGARPIVIDVEIKWETEEGDECTVIESAWFFLKGGRNTHRAAEDLARCLGGELEGGMITGVTPFEQHINKMGTLTVKHGKDDRIWLNNLRPEA